MAGYHLAEIPRGEFGKSSKILEEVLELIDAEKQGNPIMSLCELSDIIGAIEGYLKEKFPGFALVDLVIMSAATRRAFEEGHR